MCFPVHTIQVYRRPVGQFGLSLQLWGPAGSCYLLGNSAISKKIHKKQFSGSCYLLGNIAV
jgi:hypothetical protein